VRLCVLPNNAVPLPFCLDIEPLTSISLFYFFQKFFLLKSFFSFNFGRELSEAVLLEKRQVDSLLRSLSLVAVEVLFQLPGECFCPPTI